MIKANELRLFNYIFRAGHVAEVRAIIGEDNLALIDKQSGIGTYRNDGNCKPIPLTAEWLHKFGITWNNINGSEYYFTTTGLDGLRLDPPTKGEDDGWTPMTPDGDGSIGKEIFFVHQLQNLYFALTGEELTIKA